MVDDRQAVAILGLFHVVGGQKDGQLLTFAQLVQAVPHSAPSLRIQPRGGFVEKEHPRPVQERPSDFEPPPHAARKGAHTLVGLGSQANPRQRLVHARTPLAPWHTVDHAMDLQILARREAVIHGGILEDEPETTANRRWRRDHVVPGDARRALGRLEQRAENLDGRRLAGAVGTEKSKDLARGNRERNVIHSSQVAEAANQPLYLDGRST